MNKTKQETVAAGMGCCAGLNQNSVVGERAKFAHVYEFECLDSEGNLKWRDRIENLIVDAGLDEILDKFWKGSNYSAAHYVFLTDGTPTVAAGNTMASHAGWTEITDYAAATRPSLTLGAVSGQSVDNSASKASYAINGPAAVGGAGICTDSTKAGSSGVLVGAGAFTGGDKSVANGDTLNVTTTLTAAG